MYKYMFVYIDIHMDRYKYKPIRCLVPSKVYNQVRKMCCYALLCFRQTSEKGTEV